MRWSKFPGEPTKKSITIRLDDHVVRWFREQGEGYQTHINWVLCEYVRKTKGTKRGTRSND